MVYRTIYRKPDGNSSEQCELIKAKKKFNCSLLWILKKFGVDNFDEKEVFIKIFLYNIDKSF
jgi:hypothetical protein